MLGILNEGESVAMRILKAANVDVKAMARQLTEALAEMAAMVRAMPRKLARRL